MVFSSLTFIFLFLPIFFFIYYISPKNFKNTILFIGSLVFYAFGEPLYLILILLSILINYQFGRLIGHYSEEDVKQSSPEKVEKMRKFWLIISCVYNFGMLIVFKYTDFFIDNWNGILHIVNWFHGSDITSALHVNPLCLTLPLGISFYTFQIQSYCIDVYRKKVSSENSLVDLGTYLCMFPQLIAGPIVIFQDVRVALKERTITIDSIDEGLKTFIIGLGYKVLLANRIGILWNEIQTIGFSSISTPLAWLGAVAYSMQLYFDFKGYSLMAVGLGSMLGFHLPENFNHPYMAKSVTDFWRRWHITLGAWFKDYVYIPLGGNRKGMKRTIVNLLIVWFLVGFWHGAGWNFILWGLLIFAMQSLEKRFYLEKLRNTKVLCHIYMIFYILISWVIFAITDFVQLGTYFEHMFPFITNCHIASPSGDYITMLQTYGLLLLAGLLFCTDIPERLFAKIRNKIYGIIVIFGIFWASVYYLSLGMNNPFLYFRF